MNFKKLTPIRALNKAFLKIRPDRNEIEKFRTQLICLLDQINESESEEFHKNLVSDFLKKTCYEPNHFINTKSRNDLVIHNGKNAKSTVGVIIEAKKPVSSAEMLKQDNINVKAFHELLLYYLRERISGKNLEVRYLIATNINEWFIFDANFFEKTFVRDKNLVRQFTDFEAGRLTGKTTDFFYKEIARPAIAGIRTEIAFAYFDIREYRQFLRGKDKKDDKKLVPLFKLLSPGHLLKLPFVNDSNRLDKGFYSELLHIIGLTETKRKGKKLIERKKEGERNTGSLLENTVIQLDTLDKMSRLEKPERFGETCQERLFSVGLELTITWINRVLFLKLLEAQLISYHKGDTSHAFLNNTKVRSFDDLSSLFFQVLARETDDRNEDVQEIFAKVPYLNSSLFEPTELEHETLSVSNLSGEKTLPLLSSTVLKDGRGKKRTGEMNTLEYLFGFLDAYNFAGEGSEDIQEESKSLINASVLGLIFEKINGYKDGSFFTPGFVTMYMCRETLRRAVVQKFNGRKKWKCENIDDLYDKIKDRNEANEITDSLKICDPAVGSGHFLVSALNEMIAVKSELRILQDRKGRRLKEYQAEVANDELIVTDEDGELFKYNPKNRESQRVQETLFHEKQTIIENCLFGVDINPNSVKICRLRLWIELLKHAYYKSGNELETLPNIDINIKCGNSLISRFDLDADLRYALRKSRWNIDSYKIAVQTYRKARSRKEKRELKELIAKIKKDFRTGIRKDDPKVRRLDKLGGYLYDLLSQQKLFEETAKEKKARERKQKKLEKDISRLSAEIEETKSGKIYENALEWRFEFPEVLNDDGDFMGFDVVVGNPPYGVDFSDSEKKYYKELYSAVHVRTPESFNYFVYKAKSILNIDSFCSLIIPSSFLNQAEFEKSRELILRNASLFLDVNLGDDVFDDVATPTCIIGYQNNLKSNSVVYGDLSNTKRNLLADAMNSMNKKIDELSLIQNQSFSFIYKKYQSIINKCYEKKPALKDIAEDVATGISPGLANAFIVDEDYAMQNNFENEMVKKLIIGGEINKYCLKPVSNKVIIYISSSLKIKDYPNIKRHIEQYRNKLEQRVETKSGSIPYYLMLRPRREKLFTNSKILIRQTANRILAAYDEEQWYCLKSGLIIQLPETSEISYFYLLALLNSALMDFIYRDLVNENVRIFPEVKPVQLFKLPIEKSNSTHRNKIDKIVSQILAAKKQDPNADTTALEKKTDQLVYKLYGLTKEEIAIVEQEAR
ncbi:MAG: class I SAM-dependent DNA methyltransferase [Deltaproteobacteria bacterium]|nr:MAG: class I SAM-dependent DNA methyltransferase [Deltaproteobacteria bacterium]